MQQELAVLGLMATLAVAFYGGRGSINVTAEYSHADVVAAVGTCEEGMFMGGCTACGTCADWEYAAGGCTYFKDTFCTLCEPIKNCPQDQIRCDTKDNHRCLECDPGFWGGSMTDDGSYMAGDCKPCLVCEAGFYELEKCTQSSNTVCQACTECNDEQFTSTACTYFTNTICTTCTSCPVDTFTEVNCQTNSESGLSLPASVYTVRPDTVCTVCAEPRHNGIAGLNAIPDAEGPLGPRLDEYVTDLCSILKDTTIEECTLCPCEDRESCEYMTEYCTPGMRYELGFDTTCAGCTQRRGPREWEVFKCGGTSDALWKECTTCMDGEYMLSPCTVTSDTLCPSCNTNVAYGKLEHCAEDMLRCTSGHNTETGQDESDTTCLECSDQWYGDTCCYHLNYASCGTLTTRERIARRYGFEGITNEDFVQFCLELCDEFPDCMAFETEDGGDSYDASGPANYISTTAACYFKASFSQEEIDLDQLSSGVQSNSLMVFKGDDPRFDCYSNVCRQHAAFSDSYDHMAKNPDVVAVYTEPPEYEGVFRRMAEEAQ